MKSKLYAFVITAFLFALTSCKKWLPENRIEGDWTLTEIQKRRALSNETISSGYQEGVFTFYENGTASYSANATQLKGNWQMYRTTRRYRDRDGDTQTDDDRVLVVKLYDFSTNQVIDWYFDRFDFRSSGNALFAFSESPSYTYRYCFRKK